MADDTLRFSRRVPDTGVNLGFVQIPPLDPLENISLVETGLYIAENLNIAWKDIKGETVLGTFALTETVTGFVYTTTYNPTPSATGQISVGNSFYVVNRDRTADVSPSGFVVENFTSQIRVHHPEVNETGVWNLRVEDGVIQKRYILRRSDNTWLKRVFTVGDELVLFYSVAEAIRIPYATENGEFPGLKDARVIDVSGVVIQAVDENVIQFPFDDLWEISSLTLNGQELLTGSSGHITRNNPPPRGIFSSWDPENGRVTLSRAIDDRDELIANFRYREYLYTFEGYQDCRGNFLDLDFNPSPGHTYNQGRPSAELLNIPIYIYLLPTAAYRVKDAQGSVEQERKIYTFDRWTCSALRWEKTAEPISNDEVVEKDPCLQRSTFGFSYWGSANFVDDVPVDILSPTSATGETLANFPSAIILAKIFVTSNSQIENVNVIDTRRRGGGIPARIDVTDVSLPGDTRTEAELYWDIGGWDGQPIPLGGVLLFEIPADVLTGANGYPLFTHDEVEEKIRSRVAAGIRPLIRYI